MKNLLWCLFSSVVIKSSLKLRYIPVINIYTEYRDVDKGSWKTMRAKLVLNFNLGGFMLSFRIII